MQLGRYAGLRAEEAVQANKSLKTWKRALQSGKHTLRVNFGTKGDRPRDVFVAPEIRSVLLNAVLFALEVSNKRGGKLVDKPNLKAAMTRHSNQVRSYGLTGKEAFHSLRYAFAHDQYQSYISAGYSRKEALSLVGMDLGHGDGRGGYVRRVYLL